MKQLKHLKYFSDYRLSPSLMCGDLLHLQDSILRSEQAGADILHVDAIDNRFVRGFGFTAEHVRWMRSVTALPIDVHLMADPGAEAAADFCKSGATRVILHAETSDLLDAADAVLSSGVELGIAVKPETPLELLELILPLLPLPISDSLSTILAFTVNPGRRGQVIRDDALLRIAQVRAWIEKHAPICTLQADGGVYKDSIAKLAAAGADTFVVGSAFFGRDGKADPVECALNLRAALDNECIAIN